MEGTLEQLIQEASGSNLEIPSTTLTSSAVLSGDWWRKQSILSQLNIDPEEIDQEEVQDTIVSAAENLNMTNLLNQTNIDEQQTLQES